MLVDISRELTNFHGKTLMDDDGAGNAVPATFKLAIVNAVLTPVQNEKGVDKVAKYELAKKVFSATKEVELTVEEVKLIKDRVSEVYAPLIVGQILEVLK